MRRKKPLKTAFIQSWGSYRNDTLVVVAFTHEELMRRLSVGGRAPTISITQKFYDWIKSGKESYDISLQVENRGFFAHDGGASLLWLKEWDGSWDAGEVLVHELHHAVHFIIGKTKSMADECEAQAYQQEYLFRSIRRVLNQKWRK